MESQQDSQKLSQDSDLEDSFDERMSITKDSSKGSKAKKMKPKKEGKFKRIVNWFEKKMCTSTSGDRPRQVDRRAKKV